MDSIRILLYAALAFVGFQLYTDWQKDHSPQPEQVAQPAIQNATSVITPNQPLSEQTSANDVPSAPVDSNSAVQTNVTNEPVNVTTAELIRVKTDVFDMYIDTKGASIVETHLLDYPVELNSEETVQLQNRNSEAFYTVQSGLVSKQAQSPNHTSTFKAEQAIYKLAEGQDTLEVPLYSEKNGIKVVKTFVFQRGDYLVHQKTQVTNTNSMPWSGNEYRQIQRTDLDESQPFVYTYTGGVYYNEDDKYEKLSYDDMEDKDFSSKFDKGWAAMLQHYFMTALIPQTEEENRYYTDVVKEKGENRYIIGMMSPKLTLAAGESQSFDTRLYIGPKILKRLKAIAPGLELAVDFGILTIISKPMFLVLDFLHGYLGNWGWAIIFLTLGLKIIFFPLANASYKSMAKMKKIMPEVQRMKERFGDDRQRMAKEQMELFKKHKVNPVAGCLPMIIQMPFFMGLYWALLESVELRQAPFMLWIQDLSIPDPWFVLPVLMGVSMYITQKLNPPPSDPMQAKMMQIMPIAFSVIFFLLPAGLVLYSVTNSTLSIIQQWVITRRINKAT